MDKLTETERTAAKTSLNSGFTFSLTRDAHFDNNGSMFSARFEQFTSLKIESKSDSSIKGFYEKAVRFERFFITGDLQRCCIFRTVSIFK